MAALGATGHREVWEEHAAPAVADEVTQPTYRAVNAGVEKILEERSIALLVFAAAFAVWEVSGSLRAVTAALNTITDQKESRPLWLRFALSIALAVVVIVCIGLAFVVVLVSGKVLSSSGGIWHALLNVVRWPVGAVFLGLAVGVVARYAPVRSHGTRWASAGATLTVVAWLVESAIFAWFVARIANYKTAAGNLVLFLVVTNYLYLSAVVFLVGMQLDELLEEESGERAHVLAALRRLRR